MEIIYSQLIKSILEPNIAKICSNLISSHPHSIYKLFNLIKQDHLP